MTRGQDGEWRAGETAHSSDEAVFFCFIWGFGRRGSSSGSFCLSSWNLFSFFLRSAAGVLLYIKLNHMIETPGYSSHLTIFVSIFFFLLFLSLLLAIRSR